MFNQNVTHKTVHFHAWSDRFISRIFQPESVRLKFSYAILNFYCQLSVASHKNQWVYMYVLREMVSLKVWDKTPYRKSTQFCLDYKYFCDGFLGESSLITLKTENSGWTWQKSSDNHYKTNNGPIRTKCSSRRVKNLKSFCWYFHTYKIHLSNHRVE